MTAKTTKAPNYTAEQVSEMTAAYVANATKETVKLLAEKFGKSEAAIRMKLVSLGVYKKAEREAKTADETGKPVKKNETADAIGKVLRLSDGETDSLAKANRTALLKIWKALCESKPIED